MKKSCHIGCIPEASRQCELSYTSQDNYFMEKTCLSVYTCILICISRVLFTLEINGTLATLSSFSSACVLRCILSVYLPESYATMGALKWFLFSVNFLIYHTIIRFFNNASLKDREISIYFLYSYIHTCLCEL